ncbi:hypothetical protein KI387_042635, partial [Taxus chinensis]
FQFGSCYAMVIGLSLQKSDLGLPLAAMNSSVFSFLKSIPSWNDEERRSQLKRGNKSDYDVLFSDLNILIFERKMHDYSCFWDNITEVLGSHHLDGNYEMVSSNGRELAIMSLRHDKESLKVLLNTLVFFDMFASCAGTSKKKQLRFIWDPGTYNCLRTSNFGKGGL